MEDDLYTFHIGAYSPKTIPLARLAEYMAQVAILMGEPNSVHFHCLKKGSTQVLTRVQREAAPKVRDNVNQAQWPDGGRKEARAAFNHMNEMLRADNAEGKLQRDGAVVLMFPGRSIVRPQKMGPFNQPIEKDGVLVRIGGKDASAHATIEDSDGRTWSFEVSRDLAMGLAHYLFGQPVRLRGQARVFRNERGTWEYPNLKATEFMVLAQESLAEAVSRIREVPEGAWVSAAEAAELIRREREDDGGLH